MTGSPGNFFEWIIFLIQQYHSYYLQGLLTTLETSLAGTLLGCLMGFVIGIIQATDIKNQTNPVKRALLFIPWVISKIYVTIFRGTPMIVQAMVIYYGFSQMFGLDLPSFQAAILIILLNSGAYMAETVRGGINSIDPGQVEGAKALGMNYVPMMIHIILPQTLKIIAPQIGNTFVANIKDTSVLNVISVTELFYITKVAAGTYFRMFEAYTITAAIYLTLTLIFNFLLRVVEIYLAGKDSYEVLPISHEVPTEG
ncbi:MAG: amino acid ABC transporter permease [Clostridiales bacterium]|nr:amino acid ABC transporter permease [Clostridiales bacterium]